MKYNSLKKQSVKAYRIDALDGGMDLKNPPEAIKDNCLCKSVNMWYNDASLCTRPGFKGDAACAVNTMIYGYEGELEYEVTDTVVYHYDKYCRIAAANVLTDDYAHYTYVYLVDLYGEITPIGYLSFFRYSSDSFYQPIKVVFFNGKPQQGGGIFAFVTLQNQQDASQRRYKIYEVNDEFNEWNEVESYYVPTVFINGRGNKYAEANSESGFTAPAPKTLESQNMLDGKFHAYYTTDNYSNLFRMPFNGIADKEVVCRIYYNLTDYTEWTIPAGELMATETFLGDEVTAIVDRERGTIYFRKDGGNYCIPIMGICPENNMKVTATKEIKDGLAKIVCSECTFRENSKLLLAGGENGNTVFSSEYDNPLYFPVAGSVQVGEGNSGIIGISGGFGRILVHKKDELYSLKVHGGDIINKVSLLLDNGKEFRENDEFSVEQLSESVGCNDRRTIALCGKHNVWLGQDGSVYAYNLKGNNTVLNLSKDIGMALTEYDCRRTVAVGNDEYYILIYNGGIVVYDVADPKAAKAFFWTLPEGVTLQSGFYHGGNFWFLCTGEGSSLAYMAYLDADTDTVMYYDENGDILAKEVPIKSEFTTKYYTLSGKNSIKNIESVYLSAMAKSKISITVNDIRKTDINFGFSNEDYDRKEFKSVKLLPHLQVVDTAFLNVSSDRGMRIRDIEFFYRTVG